MKLRNGCENILLFVLCIILIIPSAGCGLLGINTADSGISVNSWRSQCMSEYLLFSNMGTNNLNGLDKELNDLLLAQLYLCWSLCTENSETQKAILGKTHCGE
ncbi:hypothetical protein RBB68_04410 [Leptospira interrogans]|uniref:hypothetical protein n=1 Tax=Leptospira interrogans TaxID=173 RepID=UPI000774D9D7|nr:hypothetical protein [Leptospira interrogans]WML94930.1 hypothetical protein RBB68_04410 [Leptospira interrogans]